MIGRILAALLALSAFAAPASAETWRASSRGKGAIAFIDVDSIARDGDRVTFWREVRWPEAQSLSGGLRFDRVRERYEGDCRAMTLRSMAMFVRLGEEVVLASGEAGAAEPAPSGSNAEVDLRSACFGDWPAD